MAPWKSLLGTLVEAIWLIWAKKGILIMSCDIKMTVFWTADFFLTFEVLEAWIEPWRPGLLPGGLD